MRFIRHLFLYLSYLILFINYCNGSGISNCPMQIIRHIIIRTLDAVNEDDAPLQMQIIRRIMEDIYGGNWGVLIIKDPELISSTVHWTFPDHRHRDGSAAFCLHMERGWQYNVFKTGDTDTDDRTTVEQIVEQFNRLNKTQQSPKKRKITTTGTIDDESDPINIPFSNSLLIDRNK